jgi:hypothetical protein
MVLAHIVFFLEMVRFSILLLLLLFWKNGFFVKEIEEKELFEN